MAFFLANPLIIGVFLQNNVYLCDKKINKMNNDSYLKAFEISRLWGKKNINWIDINQDVNILIGINGSGKTTLLNLIYAYLNNDKQTLKKYEYSDLNSEPLCRKNIFYVPSYDRKTSNTKKVSPFDIALNNVVMQNAEGRSFFNYRMRMLDYKEESQKIQENIEVLFGIINDMFSETQKKIMISTDNGSLEFYIENSNKKLKLDELSSGEKQLLILLLNVFLMDKKPGILLMDEPELSLHISWQQNLIKNLRILNPECQLIIATHSPSVFSKGWVDKITFMEDITTDCYEPLF